VSCPSQNYAGGDDGNIVWTNWSQRVGGPVGRFFKPNTLPDLVNVVARASKGDHRLRVVGSGWAFEDIAYSVDWMVSLANLNKPLSDIIGSALNSQWAGRNVLFHIEAGAKVYEVNDALANATPKLLCRRSAALMARPSVA
jgi:FAD/FMN-containing dehydrogenase